MQNNSVLIISIGFFVFTTSHFRLMLSWNTYLLIQFPIFINCIILCIIMVVCCICKINPGTLKITDGNPKYKGKPICKECDGYRKLFKETK